MNVLLPRKDFGGKNPLLFHYRSRSLFLEKKKFDVRIKRENVKCIKAALGRMEGKKIFYSLKVDTFDQTIVDFEKEKKSGKPKRNCTDRKL